MLDLEEFIRLMGSDCWKCARYNRFRLIQSAFTWVGTHDQDMGYRGQKSEMLFRQIG